MSRVADDVQPIADQDAESACVGAMLLRPQAIDDVAAVISRGAYSDPDLALLHGVLVDMHSAGRSVDLVTVADELRTRGLADRITEARLVELAGSVPSSHRAAEYAAIVARTYEQRELQRYTRQLVVAADSPTADLVALRAALPMANGYPRPATSTLDVVRMADVHPQPIHQLWRGRFARGKLHMISGDPGQGKSWLTTDMACRLSRGIDWPDGAPSPGVGTSLIASMEDDPEDTIRPRIDAQGGDASRIHCIRGGLSLSSDIDALRAAIVQHRAELVILDPLSAICGDGARANTHRGTDVRWLMTPLSRLASDTGACIIVVHHLRKSAAANAIHASSDSIQFIAAARAAWLVTRDPDDESRQLMLCSKMNFARPAPGIAYRLLDTADGRGVLAWDPDPVQMTADQALARRAADTGQRTERDEAADFLRGVLADGPVPSKEIDSQAREEGISIATLRRAKKQMGVLAEKVGYMNTSRWEWRLPRQGAQGDQRAMHGHLEHLGDFGQKTGVES